MGKALRIMSWGKKKLIMYQLLLSDTIAVSKNVMPMISVLVHKSFKFEVDPTGFQCENTALTLTFLLPL